jgi:16S rRNA (adenine1518-N6/adenine1519-N6)-dimethyltransferase
MFEIVELKSLLNDLKITPRKSLGQNFLINTNIVNKMVRSLSDIAGSNILEIGPGLGVLTNALLERDIKSLTVIEADKKFLPLLEKTKVPPNKLFRIINANALKLTEEELVAGYYKIVANLPYNISTMLLVKWLKKMTFVDEIVVMLQKEVADRILATHSTSNYGRISVLAQYICHCEKLFDVEPDNFFPVPKVHSSIIKLTPKKPRVSLSDIKNIEKVCKAAFNFRRKVIRKSLKQIMESPELKLKKIGIDYNKRPEELTVDDFYKISCIIL